MKKKNIPLIFVLSALCLLVFSCLKKEFVEVKGISLGSSQIEIQVGDTLRFTPVISPSNADNKELSWTSTDRNIAEVSDGLVRTISTGDVTIVATAVCGGAAATCNISVVDKVKGIKLDKETLELYEYQMGRIIATLTTSDVHNKEVLWSSADEKAVKVFDGNVVAGEAPMDGKAVAVTATSKEGGYSATCMVTVKCHVSAIKADKSSLRMEEGETEQLSYKIIPDRASDKSGTWRSTDGNVASVDSDGLVTAVRAGKAFIIVSSQDENKADTCQVEVTRPVTGITILKDGSKVSGTIMMNKEEETTLVARLMPEGATDQRIKWSSSDENIAVISQGGVLTAINGGQCAISATSEDGCHTASCNVQVSVPLKSITLDESSMTLEEGESKQLKVTFNPDDATDKEILWSSADEKAVKVFDGNVVAGEAPMDGKAVTVTATSKDGSCSATCTVTVKCHVSTIKIDKSSLRMEEGETERLSYKIIPDRASDKSGTWRSTDGNVASVDSDGLVTAVRAGKASIIISSQDGNKADTCRVEVIRSVTGITIFKDGSKVSDAIRMNKDEKTTLVAKLTPEGATDQRIKWSSSDKNIAAISQGGVLTAINGGQCTISATSEDGCHTASCNVQVSVPLKSISLDVTSMTLKEGESQQLKLTFTPADATDKEILWSSADEKAVKVYDGNVVAGEAPMDGKAVAVTATSKDGNYSATCMVTVKCHVSAIKIDKPSLRMEKGGTERLSYRIFPGRASDKSGTWRSTDGNVASVDSDGLVTAVGAGKASIIISSQDGNKADTCRVEVFVSLNTISLDKESITLKEGESQQLKVKFTPDDATDKKLVWSSEDESMVSVTEGLVHAHRAPEPGNSGPAPVKVTVRAEDGGTSAACLVYVTCDATDIKLNKTTHSLNENEKFRLVATVIPSRASNRTVIWKSGDTKIAKVSSDGEVTAVSEGSTVITARVENSEVSETCTITVKRNPIKPTSMTLKPQTCELYEGDCRTIEPEFQPDNATPDVVTWSSSNEAAVSVDQNGHIKVLKKSSKDETAKIIAKSGNLTATCTVTLKAHVSDIKLNKNQMELDAGKSESLTATVIPSVADNQKIWWSSDTESVATVDLNGKVVAVAKGTAVITARSDDGNHTATCTVTVNDTTPPGPIPVPVTGVTLSPSSKTLAVGSTFILQKTIIPANATNTEVDWHSSNTNVVSVNNGKLTALTEGESIVSVTTKDGGYTAECKVTVEAKPVVDVTGVVLNPATKSIGIGESFSISAKVSPDDATDKTLTWGSDKPEICSVDQSGRVTGKAEGSARITAKSNNDKVGECIVTVTRPIIHVNKVTVSPKSITAHPGDVIQLDYKVEPENADDKSVEWISGNSSVVKVSNGLVTILGGSVYCDVTVRSIDRPAKYSICSIKIESVNVESVSLDKSAVTMEVGEKLTLTPMILPVNATKKTVKWSSSNDAIVSVSNGVIEAKSAGKAQITVTTDDKSRKAVCNVTVTDGPSGESDFDLGGVGFGNLN